MTAHLEKYFIKFFFQDAYTSDTKHSLAVSNPTTVLGQCCLNRVFEKEDGKAILVAIYDYMLKHFFVFCGETLPRPKPIPK